MSWGDAPSGEEAGFAPCFFFDHPHNSRHNLFALKGSMATALISEQASS
jgi:hypothetical protein